ncbi:putative HEPN domain protein [Candidatus Sulfopaludibacter sp. SbA4]|nr:putative HEPN domain protein [Candidatus Sulfopaludibacter sp. SbA4]
MSVAPEVLEILCLWVRKAEHDFEAIRRIMAVEAECPYDVVCFHCQQAAEKYLKCLLTLVGVQAPRTHDLSELLRLLPEALRPQVDSDDLSKLNPYAIDARYYDLRDLQRDDAIQALAVAEAVRADARRHLPPEALPS